MISDMTTPLKMMGLTLVLLLTACGSSSNQIPTGGSGSNSGGHGHSHDGDGSHTHDDDGGGSGGGGGGSGDGGGGGSDPHPAGLSFPATYEIDFGNSSLSSGSFSVDINGNASGTLQTAEGVYGIAGTMAFPAHDLSLSGTEDHPPVAPTHAFDAPPLSMSLTLNDDHTTFSGTFALGVLTGEIAFERHNDFQGAYTGTYTGSSEGDWTVTVSKWGTISGTITASGASSGESLSGTVSHVGAVNMTQDTASYSGTISDSGDWTGLWVDGSGSGSLSGSLDEAEGLISDG